MRALPRSLAPVFSLPASLPACLPASPPLPRSLRRTQAHTTGARSEGGAPSPSAAACERGGAHANQLANPTCLQLPSPACVCVCMCICTCTDTYTCLCMCVCMCLCVCIYIYIDSYTQVTERMTVQRMSATNERALLKEQADQALVLTLTCTCARARARTHTHTHTAGARSGKNGHAPEDIADRPPSETVACCSNSRRRFQATSHTPASTPGGQTDRGCVYVWGGWWMQAHATGFYAYMRYLHTHITRTAEGRRGFGVIGARRHDRCPRPPCLAECRTLGRRGRQNARG